MIHDNFWQFLTVLVMLWHFMTTHDNSRQLVTVLDNSWKLRTIIDASSSFMANHEDLQQFWHRIFLYLMLIIRFLTIHLIHVNSWYFMKIREYSWQVLTMYDNSWQFLTNHMGNLGVSLTHLGKQANKGIYWCNKISLDLLTYY